ncbi:MAG: BTAD domain-containing putative transcriptional regulator [Thermoleophilaceae bacterium]
MNFEILGPLRVVDGDDRELALGGPKPAAVLALLILHANEVVSADRLIEELWEGQPPPTAAKSLQVHVSRLRRALGADNGGAPVVTRHSGYVLDVEPDQIDGLRFERAVAEGRAALAEGAHALASARLRSALALWRGEALADFAYASFAQDAVARLDGLRTVALEGAIDAELALGRHAELIPELKSLVRRHPFGERLRGQLMLALYRAGRQAEALGVYRAGRRVLVGQLGIEPGAELRELERAILAQDPQLTAPEPERQRRRERGTSTPGGLLVGYEHELRGLEDVLEQALVGQGRVALVSGEPGVGKTRLADELTRVAQARGAQVLWARCWDGGGAPAFWPWTQILRALVADRDPAAVRAELGDKIAEIAQLLPELDDDTAATKAPEPHDAQETRFRLFDATAAFLRRAALARPTVLVFDDLHAADPSTLSLLTFMGAGALNTPILILGTYRDTDVAGNEALTDTLTELTRTSDCVQLVLTGLTTEDTAHFVELSSGVAPMNALAAAIHEVSAGNPLFVSELVRLLRAEDRLQELERDDPLVLPRGIEQVIARRLQRLSGPCRRTLSLAAVIGNEIETSVLERAASADGEELLTQLEEAQASRVIEEAPGRRSVIRFSHDLVRQTLYGELGGTERRRMHAAVARAIEQLSRGDLEPVLPKLAHHYSEALPLADAGTAIRYLTLAGDGAAELMAYEEATSLYTRAIEIATADGAEPAALSELYVKLAEQFIRATDGPRAAAALAQAEAVAGGALAPALEGRVAIARAEHDLFDACAISRERIEEVITMFEELGDPAGEARAWNALLAWSHGHARFTDTGEAAQQMLVRARRAGSRALVDQAIRGIGASLARGPMPLSRAIPSVQALLDQVRNGASKARILMFLAELEGRAGRFDDVRALLAQARAAAVGAEAEWDSCVASAAARLELLAGNPTRAEAIMHKSCADLDRRGLYAYLSSELVYLVEALTAQGRLDEADAELERAAAIVTSTDVDAHHGQARARARAQLARGNLQAAEASIRSAIEYVDQMQWPDPRIDSLLVLARILFEAGRDDEAREVAEEALASSEAIEHQVYADRARELLEGSPRAGATIEEGRRSGSLTD